MTVEKLRWGILSTAQIARKNWKAICNSGNGTVMAVASRDLQRSRAFIAECQREAPMESTPRAFGSYEELIAAKDVDAVYVPLPTGLRKEWVLRAAAAGKHIVCEKPCAISLNDLREMLDACRQKRVQFLDGVMFMHSQRLSKMRAVLDDGTSVGDIKRITSSFSFGAPPDFFTNNIRIRSELEPYGCLGDLGWYCIRFALWAMKWQSPRAVTGRLLSPATSSREAPVPTEFSGELFFKNGTSATFYCSFITALQQCATVSGTNGFLRVSDFVLPFRGSELAFEVNNASYDVRGCEFSMDPRWRNFAVPEHSNSHATAQETNLFRSFADQVRSGSLNEEWPEWALKTQQVVAACFESAAGDSRIVEIR